MKTSCSLRASPQTAVRARAQGLRRKYIAGGLWVLLALSAPFTTRRVARACDNSTNGWVGGASNYWHGALGRADYCNNAAVGLGADRQKAADCAWGATVAYYGPPSQPGCARTAIETSPQGAKDLDDFVRIWTVASGNDCSPASIALFAPYWHGALGKPEFCNNASIGADREKAKNCAFQALVRDKGVVPSSCLRDAIANSPQGKADLDTFVAQWSVQTGLDCSPSSIALFAPYWHGALGKPEFCNNASIGPDLEKAKECAFQALVRDKGVVPSSCLRDAIANSPDGQADLTAFVGIWCSWQGGEDCSNQCLSWNDPQNCGACGNVCGGGTSCCGNHSWAQCVDPSGDSQNCGACGNVCSGGKRCFGGTCACATGQTDCGGSCSVLDDTRNCGACGQVCQGGMICSARRCVCPRGQTNVSGTCFALNSDNKNCGRPGVVCAGNAVCQQGVCVGCPAGMDRCGGGSCLSLNKTQRCGTCGNICPSGATCVNGSCQCQFGERSCGGTCCAVNSCMVQAANIEQCCPKGVCADALSTWCCP
jgi:hypothetical protein